MRCILTVLIVAGILASGFSPTARADGFKSTNIPRYDAAVVKALAWLKMSLATQQQPEGGHAILAAYAMFKCGEPVTQPFLAQSLKAAAARSSNTRYQPVGTYDHIYGAGIDAMFLSDVDPDQFKGNLQIIADYITSVQRGDGSWSDSPTEPGDDSMSQYGVLGLWDRWRAGVAARKTATTGGAA